MDSRTIYVGHKEPPPGTEAYIPQRHPDNRIVSSKVSCAPAAGPHPAPGLSPRFLPATARRPGGIHVLGPRSAPWLAADHVSVTSPNHPVDTRGLLLPRICWPSGHVPGCPHL